MAAKKKLPAGFVPFKKGGKKEEAPMKGGKKGKNY